MSKPHPFEADALYEAAIFGIGLQVADLTKEIDSGQSSFALEGLMMERSRLAQLQEELHPDDQVGVALALAMTRSRLGLI